MFSARSEGPSWRAGASITLRLTALFSGAALLILLLAAALLYWRLTDELHGEDARVLRENMATLRAAFLASPEPAGVLEQEIMAEPMTARLEPYYIRYLEGTHTVMETPGMEAFLPTELFAERADPEEQQPARWRSPAGRTYLLYSTTTGGSPGRFFQAAVDVTHDEVLLQKYGRALVALVLAGSLLAAFAGYLTARQGLRPLARLTRAMQRITARRLDQRIGDTEWPRELSDLSAVFDEMLGRLEDSFTRLSRFSADLAHELRTPLTNLRGEAEIALSQPRSEEEYRRVLESGLEELDRLTNLVDRLLFLARADAGAAALQPRPLDAAAEVERVRQLYAALSEELGVSIECGGDAVLVADPLLFRRAVANLLANALHHTSRDGRVSIEVRQEKGGATVTVSDTGAGITPEHLPHVMDRFYQADPARERRRGRAGLGLALVRSIAELHGGSIELESEPGRGTRASLFFPSDGAAAAT